MKTGEIRTVRIIPSKSYAHRALICDFLAGEHGVGVKCELESDDIEATKRCLAALKTGEEDMPCGESGSTLRFMLPLVGVLGKQARFITKGRLSERPMKPLEDELIRHGMLIKHDPNGVIRARGQLTSGIYRLPGDVSSQFITGLLLSLPHLEGESRIELTSGLKSSGYVDITLDVLKAFGVDIKDESGTYEITGEQTYSAGEEYEVEGDWSQAAFWLVMGAIGKTPVKVLGLSLCSKQGDRKIAELLRSFGAKIETDENSVTTYPSRLKGIEVDVSEIPDLAPAIAAAAAIAEGDTVLTNAERLRLKESNRIASIVRCLGDLGVSCEGTSDSMIIHGTGGKDFPVGGTCETAGDHRIVMMAAVMSLITKNKVVIRGSRAVSKSYPEFFSEMGKAGFSDNLIRE